MGSTLWQGLVITVTGMGLVFLALGILVLAMIALDRLFRPKAEEALETGASEEPSAEEVVAITVALASLLTREEARVGDRQLGSALRDGPGAWSIVGRGQHLSVRKSRRA